jgi:CheY-like chemotaxis protein
MATFLIVDDDPIVLAMVGEVLDSAGHAAVSASDGDKALDLLSALKCDLVILDLLMPNRDGLETISQIRHLYPDLPILAISGGGSGRLNLLPVAQALGAHDTLSKPVRREALLSKIDRLLANASTTTKSEALAI